MADAPTPFSKPLPPEFAGALEVNTKPYEIAGWLPLVDMFCYCRPGHTQLVHMLGIDVPSMCPLCFRIFTATGFDRDNNIIVSVQKGVKQ